MIRFDSFVQAIHSAVITANKALQENNLETIHQFFESADSETQEPLRSKLDSAMAAAKEAFDASPDELPQFHRAIQELENVYATLDEESDSRQSDPGETENPTTKTASLRPRMTTLQYPMATADGIKMCDVEVPLITLVPMTSSKISEVKLKTNLEIQADQEDLHVNFPTKKKTSSRKAEAAAANSAEPQMASLEITVTPDEAPEGLKKIVEGFEKSLRMQIPN